MTVLSQDKKTIFNGKSFTVERNIVGGKDKKYVIMGLNKDGSSVRVLGYYVEEKTAVDELQKLFDALQRGEKTYALSE